MRVNVDFLLNLTKASINRTDLKLKEIKMTENLADMIRKDDEPTKENEAGTDLDINNGLADAPVPEAEAEVSTSVVINMELLCDWFEKNHNAFENVNHVKVSIRGIDPKETLIFSVLHPDGGNDATGNPVRKLRIWDNANSFNVPELPAIGMDILNNGFQITYDIGNDILMKCYAVKTGLNIVYYKIIDGIALPYSIEKIKRSQDHFEAKFVTDEQIALMTNKLTMNADMEGFEIQYKQIHKHTDGMVTNKDAIEWIIGKKEQVMDVNHHLQLDNIMIWLLS